MNTNNTAMDTRGAPMIYRIVNQYTGQTVSEHASLLEAKGAMDDLRYSSDVPYIVEPIADRALSQAECDVLSDTSVPIGNW